MHAWITLYEINRRPHSFGQCSTLACRIYICVFVKWFSFKNESKMKVRKLWIDRQIRFLVKTMNKDYTIHTIKSKNLLQCSSIILNKYVNPQMGWPVATFWPIIIMISWINTKRDKLVFPTICFSKLNQAIQIKMIKGITFATHAFPSRRSCIQHIISYVCTCSKVF